MAGRTVIVIAHRLSTVARAHRVVVLEGGQVIEQGPPDALYKQRGVYYRLVKKQIIHRQESGPPPLVITEKYTFWRTYIPVQLFVIHVVN